MGNLYEHKNSRRSAKANGLTTQCDRKERLNSGDQNPLKKTGRIPKSQMSRIFNYLIIWKIKN